jgi:hypothetical protein
MGGPRSRFNRLVDMQRREHVLASTLPGTGASHISARASPKRARDGAPSRAPKSRMRRPHLGAPRSYKVRMRRRRSPFTAQRRV